MALLQVIPEEAVVWSVAPPTSHPKLLHGVAQLRARQGGWSGRRRSCNYHSAKYITVDALPTALSSETLLSSSNAFAAELHQDDRQTNIN